ncbi:37S ribosomal protein-like protein Rsm22 [Pleomassaria siparia CBS 279.74]|uniref:37S ribosomal protein-like protein Rsm22 n=1 Tax=Pleomassaria siparia CBS 279.74 TaxID=1314801 RepID=A0A6G1JV04_9PLEO|nr:37S ribosomal protein-like protein Rsm22 [Pleomassaria siparia CBS 279.74]
MLQTTRFQQQKNKEHVAEPRDQTDDLPSPVVERLHVEVIARRARQSFGDILPRGYLSVEEYIVYERLYGTPVFVENAEDLQEVGTEEVEGPDVSEEKQPDGSTMLLRQGEDGEYLEVAYAPDSKEALEGEGEEDDVEGAETMTDAEWEEVKEQRAQTFHEEMYERSRMAREDEAEALQNDEDAEDEEFMRAHPLTVAGRFKPFPSTVFLPKETFVDPVTQLLTRTNMKHLTMTANQIFGGPGLPDSATTAAASSNKGQKPIPLDPSQTDMGHIEADVYMAGVMPGTYSAVMSTLVEVRRRLGSEWIERLVQKKGGTILDAGSGGVAVLAWHEILKAEHERMHEESGAVSQNDAPLGKATVLTGSSTLRHRASTLLEDTTFIPRLPDINQTEEELNTHQPRKVYDVIIAPHTLWPLKQSHIRREQLEKYWALLNPKGGVLILIEKGLPRGFEVIASARQHLLDNHIASPGSEEVRVAEKDHITSQEDVKFTKKEIGMIIAPCTNHSPCPMYHSPGISYGRKDFCFFNQRYIRPPYLQRILNAKDKNHEDVQFSYVAVQRGRDQRLPMHDPLGKGLVQSEETTDQAFEGHEWNSEGDDLTPADVSPLTFPRLILPALKRRGHIILDVCTPAGTLERWTVPRSFSKQAFRDARKARWGDLWALGAKTRIPRNVRLGRPSDEFDKKGRRIKRPKKMTVEVGMGDDGEEEGTRVKNTGRYSQDRKIRGSGGRKGRKKVYNDLDDD